MLQLERKKKLIHVKRYEGILIEILIQIRNKVGFIIYYCTDLSLLSFSLSSQQLRIFYFYYNLMSSNVSKSPTLLITYKIGEDFPNEMLTVNDLLKSRHTATSVLAKLQGLYRSVEVGLFTLHYTTHGSEYILINPSQAGCNCN